MNCGVPTVALTGVTAGLGQAVVPLLAVAGARLVLLARSVGKAEAVASEARRMGSSQVDVIECDLSLLSSVRRAAIEVAQRGIQANVIINDAAVVTPTRQVTAEGNELMLATNYLGPSLLSRLVLGDLPQSWPVRLIGVGGPLHAKPDLDDLESGTSFAMSTVFEQSKTALNLFTAAAPRHLTGINVKAVIYSPGLMKTGLSATMAAAMNRAAQAVAGHVLSDPGKVAPGLAKLALSTDLTGVEPGTLFDHRGQPSPMPLAGDIDFQEALWEATSLRLGLDD